MPVHPLAHVSNATYPTVVAGIPQPCAVSPAEGPVSQIWCWMRGSDGIAAAQWISSGLSLAAVVIALVVFLLQQRRANRDQLAEVARARNAVERAERDRLAARQALYAAALQVLAEAHDALEAGLPPPKEQGYVEWLSDRGIPLKLAALRGTLDAIRSASVSEVELILALSKAIAILDGAIAPPNWSSAPIAAVVRAAMTRHAEEMSEVIGTIRALKGTEAPELSAQL